MSPRTYKIEKRRAAAEQTRSRVLEAARELIMASSVPPSIDAVAAQAGVARMTVYYQFGSKAGLLEALFDELGGRHFQSELPRVMSQADPLQALSGLLEVFFKFWSSERLVTRRIRGMAALDPDFEESIRGRDERRRLLLRTVLARIAQKYGKPSSEAFEQTVDLLYGLTSFAMFDTMSADDGKAEDVAPQVQRLARLALDVWDSSSDER
jgi:AcrR family transcriptional regulator